MTMRTATLLAALTATTLALFAAGCGSDYDDPEATPTAADERSPTSPPSSTPTAESTPEDGISALEAIRDAAIANDVDALGSFLRFTPTPCDGDGSGSGGPPLCLDGEEDGDIVDALPLTTCEGEWRRPGDLVFEPVATGTVTFVDAFVAPDDFYPPGETVMVFSRLMSGLGELGWELVLDGGAIVGVKYGCGETAQQLIELHELKDRVPLTFETRTSGIEVVDRAITAVLAGNLETLRGMVVFSSVACVAPVDGLGAPPFCLEGEPVGTLVDVFPIAHCHGAWARPNELTMQAFEDVAELYAVFNTNEGGWPEGQYAAIFRRGPIGELQTSAVELIIRDDGVVGMNTGCGMSPEAMVEFQGLTNAIVPPTN